VACISYTNVAVGEILERLGDAADHVEVSTIHSFLYKHVVKPYLHLIKDEDGDCLVNYADVDGHDEHVPSHTKVKEWLGSGLSKTLLYDSKQHPELYDKNGRPKVLQRLRSIAWDFDEASEEWKLNVDYPLTYLPTTRLRKYKQLYWQGGIIDHDDVLYFAYTILHENPVIRSFLSARFPYMFVDEFQDTNPVQTLVVKWMAQEGTTVGVIGDVEQSIFSFQGAKYKHFYEFYAPGLVDYEIAGNRRSTDSIINLLNHVRQDGRSQYGLRKVAGGKVCVCVGDVRHVARCTSETLLYTDGAILTWKNELADTIRQLTGTSHSKLWARFEELDRDRSRFFERFVAAGN